MRTRRVLLGGLAVAMLLGPAAGRAYDPRNNPSSYCGGEPGTSEVKYHADIKQAAVCFGPLGELKGAVWVDVATMSVVFDGNASNKIGQCSDGYVGVRAGGGGPYVVWSQGGNYDPKASKGDGGTNGGGSGHSHDELTPEERNEMVGCSGVDPS